ncbi:hypothetical protein [Leyella stercorea]|nr:hypothetical protein [Leyella stercorea]
MKSPLVILSDASVCGRAYSSFSLLSDLASRPVVDSPATTPP